MAGATGAGPRSDLVRGEATSQAREAVGWANVAPLDRSAVGAVGQWADLLASISHELRTPLNAVIGFSDAMHQEVFGPIGNARYREYVGHIRSSGVELLQAAEDALAMTAVLAQPKAVMLEDVALGEIVACVIDELAPRYAARGIVFDIDIDEGVEVKGDRRLLPRALRQLAAVAISRAAAGAQLRMRAVVEHGLVELRVELSAVAEDAARLVEFESQCENREMGLGRRELALWLASALLDLIDCRLEVEMCEGGLRLRTTLEQSMQASFFGRGAACIA